MGKKQDKRALDILTDKHESFTIEGLDGKSVTLYLHPLQLGRLALITKRLLDLDVAFDGTDNDVKTMWEVCAKKPKQVAEIIAIATLRTKQEIEDNLKERTELILNSPTMTPTAVSNVFMTIVFMSYYGDFLNAIRSVKTFQVMITPTQEMERIASTEGVASGDK